MTQSAPFFTVTYLSHPCYHWILPILGEAAGVVVVLENSIFGFLGAISTKMEVLATQMGFVSHFIQNRPQNLQRQDVTRCDNGCDNGFF